MNRIAYFILVLFLSYGTFLYGSSTENRTENDPLEIYLLTCSPGDQLYSLFGHTAIRVCNREEGTDIVFNYGTFDFSTDNFYYKFVKGILPYQLSIDKYPNFMFQYRYENRSVYSQRLNLTSVEKNRLYGLLLENYRPENRTYQYNFLYDNCSSRVRDIILEAIDGEVIFSDSPSDSQYGCFLPSANKSYWNLLDEYMKKYRWIKWGIHTILGTPASARAGIEGSMFLPDYLMAHFADARRSDGSPIAFPRETEFESDFKPSATPFYFTPIFVYSIAAILIFCLLFFIRIKPRWPKKLLTGTIFFASGIAGLLMVFLGYFTSHPSTAPNFNLMWANPLNVLVPFMLLSDNGLIRRILKIYFTVYLAVLAAAFLSWCFLMPSVVPSTVPLIMIMIMISLSALGYLRKAGLTHNRDAREN